ncbi:aldo/keto reductase [Primorskyibacter flagellatus]|uniref:aldo/keto reductase n=1 Tax=Primorskyibacter flagellatus TaxID=1387277 RepID=UPI003A91462B
MQTRRLGRHGPQVSAIGIGAMSFAGFYGDTTEAEAHALLDTAVELGVTHLDTSNIYGMGKSESIIGSYIASRGRNPFLIATKAESRVIRVLACATSTIPPNISKPNWTKA